MRSGALGGDRRSGRGRRPSAGIVLLVLVASLGGCLRGTPSERPPIHLNPNMDQQPRYRAQEASAFFADGAAMRPSVPGTVARGELRADSTYYEGLAADGSPVASIPLEGSDETLRRGEERYGIYCGPCHGDRGDGEGMLFVRAQVTSADLTEDRIVQMPAGRLFVTISDGFGLMPGYAQQVPVRDRWAIVAHVRTLQGLEPAFGGSRSAESSSPVAAEAADGAGGETGEAR